MSRDRGQNSRGGPIALRRDTAGRRGLGSQAVEKGKVGRGRTLWRRLCQCETGCRLADGGTGGLAEREIRKGNAEAVRTERILFGVTGGLGPCTPAARVRAGSEARPRAAREGEGLRLPAGGVEIKQPLGDRGAALPRPPPGGRGITAGGLWYLLQQTRSLPV